MNAFNSELYIELQTREILKRLDQFNNKLYLELGGKMFDDTHAERVLPGYDKDNKVMVLKKLKDKIEVIICITASSIEVGKSRDDSGITYELEVMRLIDNLRTEGILVNGVVITLFNNQSDVIKFAEKLNSYNIKTYTHFKTKGYPADVEKIVSDVGYGANSYIETTKPIVVVASPGAGGGKLGTCLSQLYHDYKLGKKSGYAKFESFPVWNLPLKHEVNMAYEASTADLKDTNMIDPYHYDAYSIGAVNYNRDIEVFPILKNILDKITSKEIYKSPTDMGINTIATCIEDEEIVKDYAKYEIIRRYYRALVSKKFGSGETDTTERIKVLMNSSGIDPKLRKVIDVALGKFNETNSLSIAARINGKILTGRDTKVLRAPASLVLNIIKELAGINDDIHLLSPIVLEPLIKLRVDLNKRDELLGVNDVLIGLSILAPTNPIVEKALEQLSKLKGADAHASHILNKQDLDMLRVLGFSVTTEDRFIDENIFLNNI